MKKLKSDDIFPIPYTALYKGEPHEREIFESVDSPRLFNSELSKEEQTIVLSWCKKLQTIKSINQDCTSYGLKHTFEYSKDGFSISNGAFKGAMLLCGFYIKDPYELNWHFNISKKSVRHLREENRLNMERGN